MRSGFVDFDPRALPPHRPLGDAFVLAGGVAKGAFIAGALAALTRTTPLRVRRVVATSAGALSAVFLASAIRDGRDLAIASAELAAIWREKATVADAFDWTASGIVRRTGLSTSAKLHGLMRQYVRPARGRRPVELRLVMTNTVGDRTEIDGRPATTFEHVARFSGSAFDTEHGLEQVFRAACAACAFPVAFEPVEVPIQGRQAPCFDGGLVDNAPLKLALGDPFVRRVFVIAPYAATYAPPDTGMRGGKLVAHLAEVLIQERLYRDLREAHATNAALARLERLVRDPRARAVLLDAMGWKNRRRVEVVEIRPEAALEGGAFDGFCRAALRDAYIEAGEDAASAWTHAVALTRTTA